MTLLERVRRMNKEEFLKKLRKRLDVLEDSEIEDIVSEYEGYIDEKVAKGLSEEEAIKELGNFEEIVQDLLAAYKVKNQSNNEDTISTFINKLGNGLDNIIENLSHKSGTDIIRLLIEIIIILFITCLLKIPFSMIKDLGGDIFRELASPIGNIFRAIWYFIVDFSYIIISVIFFIKMLEKRYFKSVSDEIVETIDVEKEKASSKKSKSTKEKNYETKKTKSDEPKKENRVVIEHKEHGLFDTITDLCMLFLKFIVLMILIGIIFYLIGMAFALGFMIYLLISGVHYYGILILLVAMFLGGELFLRLGINFIFNKKNQAPIIIGEIISIIILTGIGLSMSAIEIANTEIIYNHSNYATKSIYKEIPMTNNLSIYNYDKIVIDNINDDIIKIEYIYPDFNDSIDIEIDLIHHSNGYYLSTNLNRIRLGKNILKSFTKNLKDKKIYVDDYDIEKILHVSENTYNKLMKNQKNNTKYYTISKNYKVLNITESNDTNYAYLTLYDYLENETDTVRVPLRYTTNIELNKECIFTFEYSDDEEYEDYNISQMFRNYNLISITNINY